MGPPTVKTVDFPEYFPSVSGRDRNESFPLLRVRNRTATLTPLIDPESTDQRVMLCQVNDDTKILSSLCRASIEFNSLARYEITNS